MNGLLATIAAVVLLGAAPAPAAPTAAATVRIRDFAYGPRNLTVTAGTVVRFVNDDSEAHTVTASNRSFDSAGLDTGDAWTHRFTAAGTYAYFCALHPYMKGVVTVTAANAR
jgi:plastocyanin